MFKAGDWPFTPSQLTEVIPIDDLRALVSGYSAHLGRALTVLDYDARSGDFVRCIDGIHNEQYHEPFCHLLRAGDQITGGDAACRACDQREAHRSMNEFRTTGQRARSFRCHMGLVDMTYIVCVNGKHVGVLFLGQYGPPESSAGIEQAVAELGGGAHRSVKLSEPARAELLSLARQIPSMPADAGQRLETAARFIEKTAQDRFEYEKQRWEWQFLSWLRQEAVMGAEAPDRQTLQQRLAPIIEQTRSFLRCKWLVCFGSLREDDTVLAPLAYAGLPDRIAPERASFNWRRGGLPLELYADGAWDFVAWFREAGGRGLRGDRSGLLNAPGCVIPVTHGPHYRSALAFGPFAEPVELEREGPFLQDVANIICTYCLTALEARYLRDERKHWQTSAGLVIHQVGTALQPIVAHVVHSRDLLTERRTPSDVDEARHLLGIANALILDLSASARKTIAEHLSQLEDVDYHFELYPLAILVANCAAGYADLAHERKRCTLVTMPGVELLPQALMDVSRLSIALSNLLNNAVKYCFPDTEIVVRGSLDIADTGARGSALLTAVIQIEDTGYGVPLEEQEAIFEQGVRGAAFSDGRIEGQGLGLWEAREVVRRHGGQIRLLACHPVRGRQGPAQAYQKVFEMRLPISH